MLSKKKLLAIIFATVLVISGVVVILFVKNTGGNSMKSDIENSTKYIVSQNGASFWAYDSTPKEIIKSTKEYIKNNDYNDNKILFVFANSIFTYNPDFPSHKNNPDYPLPDEKPFIYYITEQYNDVFVGYIAMSEDGNVVETHNLMTAEELSDIKTEPDIGSTAAIIAALGYLDLSENVPAVTVGRCLYNGTNIDEFLFCYKIKFEENDNYIYINGITGGRIE